MNNEIQRKLTSLMLATIMLAGGMTFASSGIIPEASAANANLYVSAQDAGNFAGIQVVEIVVSDPDSTDTDSSEGRPDVTFGNNDVYMSQGTDGSWYAYVANQRGIDNYGLTNTNNIYNSIVVDSMTNSDAVDIYANATSFLDGYKEINVNGATLSDHYDDGTNNQASAINSWPFIQSYNIADGAKVTVEYDGETEVIEYEYDDDKDISLDRSKYPEGAYVFIDLDDSLLNLSPKADEYWVFSENGTIHYVIESNEDSGDINVALTSANWAAIGFEEGPLSFDTNEGDGVYSVIDTNISDDIKESNSTSGTTLGDSDSVILRTSDDNDNLFVNYDTADQSGLTIVKDGSASISYNTAHSVLYDTFKGSIAFIGPLIEEWLAGVELEIELIDEDRNLTSRTDETIDILDDEAPYIKMGNPLTIDLVSTNGTTDSDTLTASKTIDLTVNNGTTNLWVNATWPYTTEVDAGYVFSYINFDFTSLNGTSGTYFAGYTTNQTDDDIPSSIVNWSNSTHANFLFPLNAYTAPGGTQTGTVYFDFLSFGQVDDIDDGLGTGDIKENVDRVNDAFYRFELEETDDNTAKFTGTVEYIMINQLNVFDLDTYDSIETADQDVKIIVNDDMDGSDAITVSYNDLDSTGSDETISVKENANTHAGQIEIDKPSYSSGNTITVTLNDADLNTDSETIQSYDVNAANDWVGNANVWLAQMKINDRIYDDSCSSDLGLFETNFTLEETGDATGLFVGTLKLPSLYCDEDGNSVTTNGLDIDFEYQDYSDASGKSNESSDKASIQSNTGSVSLDRTVYPVPFAAGDFATYDGDEDPLGVGNVIVSIRVNDPDYNISASGEDTLPASKVTLKITRGSLSHDVDLSAIDDLLETDPESGIFEVDVEIAQGIFDATDDDLIYQGDILTVTYSDPNDASGELNTITDSATFDLRNAVLQTDKPSYIIGSEAIITLIEPDLNLDSDSAETWSLDLINWDSDAGDANLSDNLFDASTAGLRETGDDTGIFQVIIEFPAKIGTEPLERGEVVTLEYQDNGPAGADFVGDDDEDITIEISSSKFGASITLDQKVYTWTDKVYVTIVSPDHNFDSNSIDEIGDEDSEITIKTRDSKLEFYKLVETGSDTGIFTGELILTGFATHDADGDGTVGDAPGGTGNDGDGPTNGLLETEDEDGLTVSFEASDGEITQVSSLVRWNIGEVQFLEASYSAASAAVIRVIDPDMNLNPEAVDSFDVNIWSDTAAGGVSLRVTETNEATGIFEGTVFFTTTGASSGSRLSVSEGDTVVAEYDDHTLPKPYNSSDDLSITATTIIGTLVPPLERAPVGNLRAVDAFNNALDTIQVDQQVSITADIVNNQDKDQPFAYLVQIQDESSVTVSLSWITGDLKPGQQLGSSVSWIPTELGDYEVTAFVWQSTSNPTALSPPASTTLTVN